MFASPCLLWLLLKVGQTDMGDSTAKGVLEDGLMGECACQNQVCSSLNLPARRSHESKCVHSGIQKRTGD